MMQPVDCGMGSLGEVAAGLVTEAYQESFVSKYLWVVPVFCFW